MAQNALQITAAELVDRAGIRSDGIGTVVEYDIPLNRGGDWIR